MKLCVQSVSHNKFTAIQQHLVRVIESKNKLREENTSVSQIAEKSEPNFVIFFNLQINY